MSEERWIVIDIHNHLIPRKAAQLASVAEGKDYAAIVKRQAAAGLDSSLEIERRLKFMEEAGVDRVVLNSSAWSPQGLEMCRALNDGYADLQHKYPGRFIPCAHVPLEGGQGALDELDRAVHELGFKGLSIVSSTSKRGMDSEDLFPLYERVARLGIPIVVHPTIRPGVWGGEKYGMTDHISREYDVLRATVEVMYGVLSRIPELNFVMPHYGGGIPSQKGRIMAWHEPEGWNIPEKVKKMPKTPRELRELGLDRSFEELFGKVYFDTAGFGGWMPITEEAVKTIRPERLCFGTDFPFEIHEPRDVREFIENIKGLEISEKGKRDILGENARRLFRL